MLNIYDVSKQAGVSIATVSRVLNNSPHVSAKTKKLVMDVIAASGYVPNAFARGLGLRTMKTIGLLCPDASDPYLSSALSALEKAFRDNLYDCLLVCTGRQPSERDAGILSLSAHHVDGMVLMGSSFVSDVAVENAMILETADIPMAILNASLQAEHIYSARCDDFGATRDALLSLTQKGYSRPLYLYHALNYSGQQKFQGFHEGCHIAGIPESHVTTLLIPRENMTVAEVQRRVFALWQEGKRFDCVVTSDDILAVGALKTAGSMHLKVPGDLAIIGYNNSSICQCTSPELSSVDNRLEMLCQQIVNTMIGILQGQEMPREVVYSGKVIERGSSIAK